jgi:hypothetical protein
MAFRARFPAAAAAACTLLLGCGDEGHTACCVVTPPPCCVVPSDPSSVPPGAHSGPTEITFLAADPAPGSTLAGCQPDASGCDGRIRMRFRLLNRTGGPVLDAIGFLHGSNKLACWRGTTGPFRLEAGVTSELLVVFDQRDPRACVAPSEIATMKLVVEGTVETASLQEWVVHYDLRP